MGYERRRKLAAYVFIGPWLLGFLIFTVYPLLFSCYVSFCDWSFTEITWAGLKNYRAVLSEREFWYCGLNTVVYGLLNTPVTLTFALLLALLINQKLKGIKFFRALYFLPVVAASDVISTTAGSILFKRIIVFNIDLSRFGIVLPEQTKFLISIGAMLLTLGLWRTGIQMLIFLMGLENVPHEYYEAAVIDGADEWHKFWWVTIPAISPMILLNILLTVVESFTSLATTMQMVSGGRSRLFIWDYVSNLSYIRMNYTAGLAVCWLFILVILALIGLIYKLVNKKVINIT